MRNTLIATSTVAILALGAGSALAQSGSSSSGTPSTGAATASSGSASSGSAAGSSSMSGMPTKIMSQDKVRQVMKDAGFQNVQIMDAAYLVQAQTKDGDQILVLVNAPMMNRANAAATTGSTTSGSMGSGAPNTSSGTSSGTAGSGSNPSAPK